MKKILITGGAGYIGSHMVYELINNGEDVVVIDNLETGHLASVHEKAKFYKGDIRNMADLDKVFTENDIEAIIHFAANSLVGESMQVPLKYFNNNTCGMEVLLEAMVKYDVKKIVFSSTAATYGEPKRVPILETDETNPTNPYGESKRMMEKMMKWVDMANGIKYVSLRYFNVAGAVEDGHIGEAHTTETHLIPIILQVPLGKRDHITVFGTDYPTADGTCIRDYVHVMDLADAHMKALNYLREGNESNIFNFQNNVYQIDIYKMTKEEESWKEEYKTTLTSENQIITNLDSDYLNNTFKFVVKPVSSSGKYLTSEEFIVSFFDGDNLIEENSFAYNQQQYKLQWSVNEQEKDYQYFVSLKYEDGSIEENYVEEFVSSEGKRTYFYQPNKMGKILQANLYAREKGFTIDENLNNSICMFTFAGQIESIEYKLFDSGSGTQSDPYIITNSQEFKNIAIRDSASNKVYFKLANTINLESNVLNQFIINKFYG